MKFKDTVSFNVDGKLVEIKVNLYPKNFSTQAFIDGGLVIEELMPEMKEKVQNGQDKLKKDKSKNLQLIGVWIIFMLMFLAYFQWKG
ncbi:MAG: hypothetical protein SVW51_18015 [Pseudomonadota bacterium]|nr:hypothetical protein [Pseudomonadota bacterium]